MKHIARPLLLAALLCPALLSAQSKSDIAALAQTPRTQKQFGPAYKISFPNADPNQWDEDFAKYYHFLNKTLRSTQMSLNTASNGVKTMIMHNAVMPHAQLDTATIIRDPARLQGTWRMLCYRRIRFTDSVSRQPMQLFRSDTVLADQSTDEAFAVFDDNNFQLYAREAGKQDFRRHINARYKLEGERYIMLYKLVKTAGGVSQIGIDENGYLILNYPTVVEDVKPGAYNVYHAVIQQQIFEKVK